MTTQFKITRNAGEPPCDRRGRKPKYPFDQLEVGDAFDVPADASELSGDSRHPVHSRVSASASKRNQRSRAAKRKDRFVVRYLRDESVVRCWRIA